MENTRLALLLGDLKKAETLIAKSNEHNVYNDLCDFYDECKVRRVPLAKPIRKMIIDFVMNYRFKYDSAEDHEKINFPGRINLLIVILEERVPDFEKTSNDEKVLLLDFLSRSFTVFEHAEDKEMREKIPWKELRFMMCILIATKTDRNHLKYPFIDFHFQFLATDELIGENLKLLLKALKINSAENWTDLKETYSRTYHYYLLMKLLFFIDELDNMKWTKYTSSFKCFKRIFQIIGSLIEEIEKTGYLQDEVKEKYNKSVCSYDKLKRNFIAMRDLLSKYRFDDNSFSEWHPFQFSMEIMRLDVQIFDFIIEEQYSIKKYVVSKWIAEEDLDKLRAKILAVDTLRVHWWRQNPLTYKDKYEWFKTAVSEVVSDAHNSPWIDNSILENTTEVEESLNNLSVDKDACPIDENIIYFLERIKRRQMNSIHGIKDELKSFSRLLDGTDILGLSKALTVICQDLKGLADSFPESPEKIAFDIFTSQCLHHKSMYNAMPLIHEDVEDQIGDLLDKITDSIDGDIEKLEFKRNVEELTTQREMIKSYKLFSGFDSNLTKKLKTQYNSKPGKDIAYADDPLQIIEDQLIEKYPEHLIVEEFLKKIECIHQKDQIIDHIKNKERILLKNQLLKTIREYKSNTELSTEMIFKEMVFLELIETAQMLGSSFHQNENYLDSKCPIPLWMNLQNYIINGDVYFDLFLEDLDLIIDKHIQAISEENRIDNEPCRPSKEEDVSNIRRLFEIQMEWVKSTISILTGNSKVPGYMIMLIKARDCNDRTIIHYLLDSKDNEFLKYLIFKFTNHPDFESNFLFELILEHSEAPVNNLLTFNFQCLKMRDLFIDGFVKFQDPRALLMLLCQGCPDFGLFKTLFNYAKVNEPEFLYLACAFNQIDIVKLLIRNRFYLRNINTNLWGNTPLDVAVMADSLDLARYLIEKGANVNTLSPKERQTFKLSPNLVVAAKTPLNSALKNGNLDMLKLLLNNGAAFNHHSIYFYVDFNRDTGICEFLIDKYPNLLKYQGRDNEFSIVISACLHGNEQILKYLVEKGANLNIWEKLSDLSVLRAACKGFNKSRPDIIEYLISKGAPVKIKGNPGPLFTACEYEKEEFFKLLLKKGANPLETFGPYQTSVLDEAIKAQSIPIMEELFKRKAKINENTTMICLSKVKPDIFRYLLTKDTDVEWMVNAIGTVAYIGNSELFAAMLEPLKKERFNFDLDDFVSFKDPEVTKIILNYPYLTMDNNVLERNLLDIILEYNLEMIKTIILKGVQINYKYKFMGNSTPLHIICGGPNIFRMELFELFISKGANLKATDSLGRTPLQMAAKWLKPKQLIRVIKVIEKYRKVNITINQTK